MAAAQERVLLPRLLLCERRVLVVCLVVLVEHQQAVHMEQHCQLHGALTGTFATVCVFSA